MPFILPDFNLLCSIWTGIDFPFAPVGPARITGQICALIYGKRTNVISTGGTGVEGVVVQGISLVLPPLIDIRGPQDFSQVPDIVECPEGTGRYYQAVFVDDIGKGHANEHRTATLVAIAGTWVAPYL